MAQSILRNFVVEKLRETLQSRGIDTHTTFINVPKNMEIAIFNFCVKRARESAIPAAWESNQFKSMYKHKYLSVRFNLIKYDTLIQKILSRELKSHEIPVMFHREIDPEKWLPIYDRLAEKAFMRMKAADTGPDGEERQGIMACPKCKSKKTDYYQLQTRSADESITSFFTCLDCGKRWKV